MAKNERKILTTLALDGDAAFKKGMDNSYNSMKTLNSEMKLSEAEFGKGAVSMEGMRSKSEILTKQIANEKDMIAKLEKAVKDSTEATGANSAKTLKHEENLNKAKAALVNMEAAQKKNNEAMDKGAYSSKALADKMEELSTKCTTVGGEIQSVGEKVSVLSAAAVAAGAAIVKVTIDAGKLADGLMTTSAQTGVSTKTLQEWEYAAKFVDTEIGTMTKGLGKVTKAAGEANAKNQDYIELSGGLKVAIKGANGALLSSEDIFYNAIDALGKMENATERDIATQELFGKSFQEMNPLIKAGSGELKRLGEEAQAAGIILSDEGVKALGAFDDSMERMTAQATSAKNNLALAFAPAIEDVVTEITDAIGAFSDWIKTLDESEVKAVITIGLITAATGPLIVGIGKVVSGIGTLTAAWPAMLASPVTPYVLGIAAAMLTASAASAILRGSIDRTADKMRKSISGISDFSDGLGALESTTSDVNDLLSTTGQTVSQLEESIKVNEDAITSILSTALEEHRTLRAQELTDIREYNRNIEELNTEKLQMYRDQQIAELQKIYLEENAMTQEQAQQSLVNAQAALDAADKITEDAYTAELVKLENFHRAEGTLGTASYFADQQRAKESHDLQLKENDVYLDKSVASIAASASRWISTDTDKYAQLNALNENFKTNEDKIYADRNQSALVVFLRQKELNDQYATDYATAWNQINVDSTNAYLAMIFTAQKNGVELTAEQKTTVNGILGAYSGLPDGMKQAGKDALVSLIGGMDGQIPALGDTSKDTVDEIVLKVKSGLGIGRISGRGRSAASVPYDMGANFVQGMQDGMNSKADSASSTAATIAQDLVDKFKSIWGEHSPSTVMAASGKNLMLGLSIGMASGAGHVVDELKGFVFKAMNGVNSYADKTIQERAQVITDMLALTYETSNMLQGTEPIRGTARGMNAQMNEFLLALQAAPAYSQTGEITKSLQSVADPVSVTPVTRVANRGRSEADSGNSGKKQTIYYHYAVNATDTSYAQQSKLAEKASKNLARELSAIA